MRFRGQHVPGITLLGCGFQGIQCRAALVLLRAGDSGAALDALEAAAEQGYPRHMLAAEPHLKPLRADPRFAAIVDRE